MDLKLYIADSKQPNEFKSMLLWTCDEYNKIETKTKRCGTMPMRVLSI